MENYVVKKYLSIVDMIAKTYGEKCEIVIHDLTNPQNSVVHTVNNHVTGREVGQSFEHLVTQVLLSQNFENDCAANYYYTTDDNRLIKSSTALLRNDENRVVAAICINIEAQKGEKVVPELLENIEINEPVGEKHVHVMEIVDDIIEHTLKGKDVKLLKREEKIEIVRFMNNKGIFLIKGAIDKVSEKMSISKVTIYSYMDEIRGKK